VWGNGYSVVNSVLQTPWPLWPVLLVLIAKVFATAATTGSGAVGGVFTPTIFVGALLGLLNGSAAHVVWPGSSLPIVYAVVGMGTFLAATTHAPLMSFLIVFEMTLEYQLVLGADAGLPGCLPCVACAPARVDLPRRPASQHGD
jgi:chloride channel protein, CIC family